MSISHRQPVVIPDPKQDSPTVQDPVFLVETSQTFTIPTAVANNSSGPFTGLSFLPKYYPLPDVAYRLTLNYVINSATFAAGVVNGSIGLVTAWVLGTNVYGPGIEVTNYVNGSFTSTNRFPGNTLTFVFRPLLVGSVTKTPATLVLAASNSSGQILNAFSITVTFMSIEEVSTNLTILPALNA